MSYQIFTDAAAERLFAHNSMREFDDVWSLKTQWFEPPNDARGGWSGASRVVLATPEGGTLAVFLKRQENHCTRTWRAPFGVPTFRREYENILRLRSLGIPAVPAPYYGEARRDGRYRAAIATVAMDDYLSLDGGDPSAIFDIRYSMVPNEIEALWGIQLDSTAAADRHVEFFTSREVTPARRRALIDLLLAPGD